MNRDQVTRKERAAIVLHTVIVIVGWTLALFLGVPVLAVLVYAGLVWISVL